MNPVLSFRGSVQRGEFELTAEVAVGTGEVVAVIGPNGAGKSTLLRSIAGLEQCATGRIGLDGQVVDDAESGVFVPPAKRRVGVVFQDYRLFPHATVIDNVAFGPRSLGQSRAQSRRTAEVWLQRLDIEQLGARRPAQLSGGQAQRVALARALAVDPTVLLLDEPLAALDAGTRTAVRSELRDHVRASGLPTLLVTHDPLDALVMADRIVVIEGGRVTQEGSVLEVARRPRSHYVARLLGLNLLRGLADRSDVALEGGGRLQTTDTPHRGPVLVAVRPDAISLHAERPSGSARNVWQGIVAGVEPAGDRVRVMVEGPPLVMVDVTAAAVAELGLHGGRPVWLSAKATELEVYPDSERGVSAGHGPTTRAH